MISFERERTRVVFEYVSEFSGNSWVHSELRDHGEVTVSRAFTFKESDLLSGPEESEKSEDMGRPFRFIFAELDNGYLTIPGRVLGIPQQVLITEEVIFERKLFVAERNIGIFRRIAKAKQGEGEIVIGGNLDSSIPLETFRDLLAKFPDTRELDRYANARVEAVIGEYIHDLSGARECYESYLSRRKSFVSARPLENEQLIQAEIDKFIYLRDTIRTWLDNVEAYSERDWQRLIVKLILLILPKYIAVLENVAIADFYSSSDRAKKRYIDICLVDASGNLDVIEIKRPFDNALLGKRLYRDNSLPARELSGSIMQSEKYLFHLSKWGSAGERVLSKRYAGKLPEGMSLQVTNPKAIIILGRDYLSDDKGDLSSSQKLDLEIIKRKYARMMDILTYDDLLRRLDNIISSLRRRELESEAWITRDGGD